MRIIELKSKYQLLKILCSSLNCKMYFVLYYYCFSVKFSLACEFVCAFNFKNCTPLLLNIFFLFLFLKYGMLHEFALSSLCRNHANLLCITLVLVYVLPKRALLNIFSKNDSHSWHIGENSNLVLPLFKVLPLLFTEFVFLV